MASALAHSLTETHFEVHILKQGRWMIEATSMVQQEALDDAKDLIRQSDVRGVKVFKESTNLDNGRSAAISIFSQLKPERSRTSRQIVSRVQAPLATTPAAKPAAPRQPASRPVAATEDSRGLFFAVIATAVIMVAAAGIYLYTIVNSGEDVLPTTIEVRDKPAWLTKPLQ